MTDFWHTGICDCCNDCGSCCITYWVPCVQYGMNAEKLQKSCCLCGCIYCVLLPCACCTTWYQRNQVRSKYGIAGGPCSDCTTTFFCRSCALCQISRELDYQLTHQKESGSGNGNITFNNTNGFVSTSVGPSNYTFNGQPQGGPYPPAPPPQGGAYPPPNMYNMQPPPQNQSTYPTEPIQLDTITSAPEQPVP